MCSRSRRSASRSVFDVALRSERAMSSRSRSRLSMRRCQPKQRVRTRRATQCELSAHQDVVHGGAHVPVLLLLLGVGQQALALRACTQLPACLPTRAARPQLPPRPTHPPRQPPWLRPASAAPAAASAQRSARTQRTRQEHAPPHARWRSARTRGGSAGPRRRAPRKPPRGRPRAAPAAASPSLPSVTGRPGVDFGQRVELPPNPRNGWPTFGGALLPRSSGSPRRARAAGSGACALCDATSPACAVPARRVVEPACAVAAAAALHGRGGGHQRQRRRCGPGARGRVLWLALARWQLAGRLEHHRSLSRAGGQGALRCACWM